MTLSSFYGWDAALYLSILAVIIVIFIIMSCKNDDYGGRD